MESTEAPDGSIEPSLLRVRAANLNCFLVSSQNVNYINYIINYMRWKKDVKMLWFSTLLWNAVYCEKQSLYCIMALHSGIAYIFCPQWCLQKCSLVRQLTRLTDLCCQLVVSRVKRSLRQHPLNTTASAPQINTTERESDECFMCDASAYSESLHHLWAENSSVFKPLRLHSHLYLTHIHTQL